jgi:hypothetical protein
MLSGGNYEELAVLLRPIGRFRISGYRRVERLWSLVRRGGSADPQYEGVRALGGAAGPLQDVSALSSPLLGPVVEPPVPALVPPLLDFSSFR